MTESTSEEKKREEGEDEKCGAVAQENAVSVIGYSLRAPNCSSVPEFAEALRSGQDLTTSNTRYPHGHLGLPPRQGRMRDSDIASFDFAFFGLSHKQAEAMDPAIRLLLKVSYEALMDANIDIQGMRGSKTGVYVGHCFSDVCSHSSSSFKDKKTGYELVNGAHAMASNRLSYYYDLRGKSVTIDTACSSSLVALDLAAKDLASGVVDRALVGGLSLTLDPHKNATFNAFKMLSPTGRCYSFDHRADGYCRADGCACVVLERGVAGYAQVVGTGTNSDGKTPQGITYPSSEQQANLMKEVFDFVNVDPRDVVYQEAHGTGTIVGDKEELSALSAVFPQSLRIGSVKSNMGHAEGASGLMGLIKILLMYEDKMIYPNFDFQESPHSAIRDGRFSVLQNGEPLEPGLCGLSNFGFGGTNAFALLTPCHEPRSHQQVLFLSPVSKSLSVPFSAATSAAEPKSSHQQFYAMQRHLGNHQAFKYEWKQGSWQEVSPLVFVCSGQGSQWNNMGQDLMASSTTFRSTIERLEKESGISLVDLYEDGTKWLSKEHSTVGIVSFQLGLLAVLREIGISPDLFLGHSLGEIVCAYLAGFQSEAEVLRVAQVRSSLVSLIDNENRLDVYDTPPASGFDFTYDESDEDRCNSQSNGVNSDLRHRRWVKKVRKELPIDPGALYSFDLHGKMVVVGCTVKEVEDASLDLGLEQTCVACYNGVKSQTISGPAVEVDKLVNQLTSQDTKLFVRELPTDGIAYHAKYMRVFQAYLTEQFGQLDLHPVPPSWMSTSDGSVFSEEYLVNNICRPVHFLGAIESLPEGSTVVEIGPSVGLLTQIKRIRSDLNRIALVEREKPVSVEQWQSILDHWAVEPKTESVNQSLEVCILSEAKFYYQDRYPSLWDQQITFGVPLWKDFELPATTDTPEVRFDLTKSPWSSIRDHCIRGQNLFPATGFIYALWSARDFAARTEILDFRVLTPLVISTSAKSVNLKIHQAGSYCEVWDVSGEVCYAQGRVHGVASTACPFLEPPEVQQVDGIQSEYYYPHIRRLGYEYGPSYQLLDTVTWDIGCLSRLPSDWVAYLDVCLHMKMLNETSFAYPVGFHRIVLWEKNLHDASLWVKRRGENTFGNASVLLEELRMEYVPATERAPTVHGEVFLEYTESEEVKCPSEVAALLARESPVFCVVEPLACPELKSIVDSLRGQSMVVEDGSSTKVVIADATSVPNAQLLVTTSSDATDDCYCLVARWGKVRLLRLVHGDEPPVISNKKKPPT